MDEEQFEKRKIQYLIPANVSTRFELFPGFGWRESIVVGIFVAIGLALFLLLGIPTREIKIKDPVMTFDETGTEIVNYIDKEEPIVPMPIRFIILSGPAAIAFFATKKIPGTNRSLVDNIRSRKEFNSRQKRYLFKLKI